MIYAFFALVAVTLAVSLFDWRRGIFLCLAVGFLQDPARKLYPDRPVAFVVVVAFCFVACLAGVYLSGRRLGVRPLLALYPRLRAPILLFVAIVVAQSAVTFFRTGNPVLAGLGVLSYLSPPLALLLGFQFETRFRQLERWLTAYLCGTGVVAATVLLQYAGFRPRIFDSIGIDLVYGRGGGIVMMNGILRSSEIAAWHLAAGACLLGAYVVSARSLLRRLFAVAAFNGFLLALLLTGRRKMLGALVLFLLFFLLQLSSRRRALSRVAWGAAGTAFAAAVALQAFGEAGPVAGRYVERGLSVFGDATSRLHHMTIGQFEGVLRRNGFFGSGAGTGAQGAQYFGGGAEFVGAAAEGGLGKVLAELGVPGFLSLAWLALVFAALFVDRARRARGQPADDAIPRYALLAFLPANAAVFLTAHQVFGDPFVLILLGWMSGTVLAQPLAPVAATAQRPSGRPKARHAHAIAPAAAR